MVRQFSLKVEAIWIFGTDQEAKNMLMSKWKQISRINQKQPDIKHKMLESVSS